MQALSQFIERNAATFAGRRLLWLNPPGDAPWRVLAEGCADLRLFCQDRADHDRLKAAGADPVFGDFPEPAAPSPDGMLLTLPREKPRLRMLAAWAAACLPPDGVLWVAGENRAGIKSAAKPLGEFFGAVRKLDSARHCGLLEAGRPVPDSQFDADDWRKTWRLDRPEGSLTIHSWPGVFAHGALDVGTAVLLDHLPDIASGASVLDFGCGAGVIAASVLRAHPDCRLTCSDANALALRATRATLAANAMRAEVVASDGLADIDGRFDWIFSNPPWHERHLERRELGMALLASVRGHLAPGGRLCLVANRHLPWPDWLDGVFGRHEQLADAQGYRVLQALHGSPGATRRRPGP